MSDFELIGSDTNGLLRTTCCSDCWPPGSKNGSTPEKAPSSLSGAIPAGLPKLCDLGLFHGSLCACWGFGRLCLLHINAAPAVLNLCLVPSVVIACDGLDPLDR